MKSLRYSLLLVFNFSHPTLCFAVLRYHVLVRTSAESSRLKMNSNNHQIYLCLYGENGDTGRRFLIRKPTEFPDEIHEYKPLFAPGQVRIEYFFYCCA